MKVLLATDGSDEARAAAELVAALPLAPGSAIRLAAVIVNPGWEVPQWMRAEEWEWAQRVVEEGCAALRREGVTVDNVVPQGDAAHEILREADEFEADVIVLGSKAQVGLRGFLLGSVARNVAKHARRPVLIGRAPQHGLKRAIVAVDESEHARHAVEWAARMPLPAETAFTVVHVLRPYEPYGGLVPTDPNGLALLQQEVHPTRFATATRIVEDAAARLRAAGHPAEPEVHEGDPAETVLDLAGEREADLIIAGARGISVIQGLLVGSVADRLLKSACCSIAVVH